MRWSTDNFLAINLNDQELSCWSWLNGNRLIGKRCWLEPGLVVNHAIDDVGRLADKLTTLIDELKLPGIIGKRQAAICLPRCQTYVYGFFIAAVHKRNIEAQVLNKAKEILPVPLERLYWDYAVSWGGDQHRVVFAAVPQGVFKQYHAWLSLSGLRPAVIDVAELSVMRVVGNFDSNHHLILEKGDNSLNLLLSDEQAWLRLSAALPVHWPIASEERLPSVICSELKKCLDYYEKKYSCRIGSGSIIGQSKETLELGAELSGCLGLPIEAVRPADRLMLGAVDNSMDSLPASLIGLLLLPRQPKLLLLNLLTVDTELSERLLTIKTIYCWLKKHYLWSISLSLAAVAWLGFLTWRIFTEGSW